MRGSSYQDGKGGKDGKEGKDEKGGRSGNQEKGGNGTGGKGGKFHGSTVLCFLNQLVGFLTLGIYTPIEIKVTCAALASASADPASLLVVARGASPVAKQAAFTRAVSQAAATRKSVYVEF
jgi:hypothetical protein